MYDGYRLSANDPVIRLAWEAAEEMGLTPTLKEAGGGSDANIFNAMGLPTCVLSTGQRQVHTHEENIAIEDLIRTTEWVLAIARKAASISPP
jgi:tripeptide aminopeptidase